MPNNLYPSYVRINYHSAFGNHAMTLPTLRWTAGTLGTPGTFETHDAVGIAADVMVEALVDLLAPKVPATTVFDTYEVFDAPTLTTPLEFNPVYGASLAVTGSLASPTGQAKAVQYTVGLRTTLFGRSQIVFLDIPCNNSWGNVTVPDSETQDIIDEFCLESNGWAGRDGGRPFYFTNISISLNKRLRRKYGMI